MAGDATLTTLVPGLFHGSTAVDKTPTLKPFILFRVIADRPDLRGDDADQVESESFLIFVHNKPGDYLVIDTVVARLKVLFSDVRAPLNNPPIIRSRWTETSDDFRDDEMGTIMKYIRIQVFYRN